MTLTIIGTLLGKSAKDSAALQKYRTRLYRVAYSWTHNAAIADDVVQETLTKAIQKADQLRNPDAGEAWLFSILSNCYRDYFRRQREMDDIDDIELIHNVTPEQENSRQQTVNSVRKAIQTLAEGQRQVVTLVDLEGFSYVEVAEILQVPVGTVMSRLCRARRALKKALLETAHYWNEHGGKTPSQVLRRVK